MISNRATDESLAGRVVWRGPGESVVDLRDVVTVLTVVRHALEDLYMGLFSWDRYVIHQVVMSRSERNLMPKNVTVPGSVRSELTGFLEPVSQREFFGGHCWFVTCHATQNIGV